MTKQQFKVIHLELIEPAGRLRHYYFGSVTAIYETFTHEDIGITKESLWNESLSENKEYRNNKCIIRLGKLRRKRTLRGGYKKGGDL